MKKARVNLLAILLYIIVVTILFVSGSTQSTGGTFTDPTMVSITRLVQALSVTIVFILPAVLFAVFLSGEGMAFLNLKKTVALKPALLTAALILSALPAINILAEWNSAITFPESLAAIEAWLKASEANAMAVTEAFMKMDGFGDFFANLIVMAAFAAFSEEVFFRGILQRVMIQNTAKVHLSIWISAFLFSALHGQFYGLIPRMLLGGVLGYLYHWSGSIWLPVFAHFVNNAMAVKLAYLIQIGIIPEEVETFGTGSGEIVWFALSVGVTIALAVVVKRSLTTIDPHDTQIRST